MTNCPHCGCPIPDRVTACPHCGTPKAPPMQSDDVSREQKAVGRFGAIATSIILAFLVLIVLCGASYAAVMGCLGACGQGYGTGNAAPPPANPFAPYVVPVVTTVLVMWAILAIVIFVIGQRRRR